MSSSPRPIAAGPAAHLGDERDLCRAVAAGDPAAITRLYHAKFDLVLATARRITSRDESFGLDAAQEVFLRVLRAGAALGRLESANALDRWLIRATHSACIDLIRRESRRRRRERSAAPILRGDADASGPDLERLMRLLAELDGEDRAMLALRTSGHTLDSVARASGLTPGAAHGRLRRALDRLARRFREVDHD